jgi:hypothetical protein
VKYRTFDNSASEVLRLNFKPARVSSGEVTLAERKDLSDAGFTVQPLSAGDVTVRVRHTKSNEVSITSK